MITIFDKELSTEKIDLFIRKVFFYFIMAIFITTIMGSFISLSDIKYSHWNIGDWLINYQGGFVRRGFFGEFIYNISKLSHINPGILVCFFQVIFYAIFFRCSYFCLKQQKYILPYIILLFSPFIYTFQVVDIMGGYRKEVVYFAILSFTVFSAKKYNIAYFKRAFYLALIFYPLLILSHEMFAIFLPYLFIVYLSVVKPKLTDCIILFILTIPSLISFNFSLKFLGSVSQADYIFYSIEKLGYPLEGGAIEWIGKTSKDGAFKVHHLALNYNYIFSFLQLLLISSIAYIPLHRHLAFIFKKNLSKLLLSISIIGTIFILFIAYDWGRFIYIHLVSIFLLSLLFNEEKNYDVNFTFNQSESICIALFMSWYFLGWHIPHCCSPYPYVKYLDELNIFYFSDTYNLFMSLL